MLNLERSSQRLKRFQKLTVTDSSKLTIQEYTYVAKGSRLRKELLIFLETAFAQQAEIQTRQRFKIGDKQFALARSIDIPSLMATTDNNWAITTTDALVEWATAQGYRQWAELKKDYQVLPLGFGDCTVELALDPARTDLIEIFSQGGIQGLIAALSNTDQQIATDTPGIAKYFFPEQLIFVLSGGTEIVNRARFPAIIGIVESGNSLEEEGWLRLTKQFPDAQLLRSQVCAIKRKKGGKP